MLERKDREYIWKQVSSRESLTSLTRDINWLKLWDDARDYGLPGVRALEATLCTISIPVFVELSCHICSHKYSSSHHPAEHIAKVHLGCTLDHLLGLLTDPSDETFTVIASLKPVASSITKFSQA